MGRLEELSARALGREKTWPALEFEKRWLRWGELDQVAQKVWALLESSGVQPGAPVAFVPRNRPSAVATLLALIAKGHTIRMIYAFQGAAGIARDIARRVPAAVLAAAEDFSPEVLDALREQHIPAISLREMDAELVAGFDCSPTTIDPIGDEAKIEILTSGTTGPPKPFALDFELIAGHLDRRFGISVERLDDAPQHPSLLYFPLANISGLYNVLPAMLGNGPVVLLERFTVAGFHDYVLRHGPQSMALPPAAIGMIMDADVPVADLASLRMIAVGSAPLDQALQRSFEARYGIPILLSYGATEFAGRVSVMTPDLHAQWGAKKFGSVGRPFDGAELRVVDPQTGALLAPGHEGLLEVRVLRMGPDWVRTADIALIDEDGFLYHRGRADSAIIRGGFKLLPETIERALLEHGAICSAAVIGLPDRRVGELPAAVIQLKRGAESPSVGELELHLRGRLTAPHIPVAWCFVETLPRTESMKIDRPALRALFKEAT